MAVPARIFVGITVFGLIATVVTGAFAVIVLSCNDRPTNDPVPAAEGRCDAYGTGLKVLVVMATLFSGAFTYLAWKSLLGGARAMREGRPTQTAGGEPSLPSTAQGPTSRPEQGASSAEPSDDDPPRKQEPPAGYV